MGNGSVAAGAAALVGLDGFVVVAMDLIDREHWLLVETPAANASSPRYRHRRVPGGRHDE